MQAPVVPVVSPRAGPALVARSSTSSGPTVPRAGMRRYQRRLEVTAGRLVGAGWPIVPGAWWSAEDGRYRCDLAGCMTDAMHPAPIPCHEGSIYAGGWPDLTRYALTRTGHVTTRWAHRPYAILVVTGVAVDVAEAPTRVAEPLLHHLRMTGRPVLAARTGGRVLVFLTAGQPVHPDRAAHWTRQQVLLHQRGSWVVLPLSITEDGRVRWISKPPRAGPIPLPAADAALPVLDQLCPPPPPPARGVVSMPAPHVHTPKAPGERRTNR